MQDFKRSLVHACQDKTNHRIIICTFIISAIAHLYRWTNASFVHDSTLVHQCDSEWQISLGRYMMQYYLKMRRYITAPLLIGLIATVFLSLSVILVVKILDIRKPLHILLVCGLLSTDCTLVASYGEYLPWVDIYMLSLLLSTTALYILLRVKKGYLISSILIAVSMGLYQCYIEVFVTLFLLWIILQIIRKEPISGYGASIYKFFFAMIIGGILYYLGWKASLRIYDVAPATSRNGVAGIADISSLIRGMPSLVKGAYGSFFAFFASSSKIVLACNLLIGVALLISAIMCSGDIKARLSIFALLVLFPLCANFVYVLSQGYLTETMRYSSCLFYLCALLFVSHSETMRGHRTYQAVTALLLVLIISTNVIHSNQVYLQKDLDADATLSAVTRVIDRIELTDGYVPNETPVALVGTLDQSSVSLNRDGFDSDSHYATTYYETYENYFSMVLGYPIKLLDKDTAAGYAQDPAVISMPAFPSVGCTEMIDGVLVVKLSDNPAGN